jgi:hypothetical protein
VEGLAADLLLLALDDDSGTVPIGAGYTDLALAGAVLVELVDIGRVELVPEERKARAGRERVRIFDDSPTGSALYDGALSRLAGKNPRSTHDAVQRMSKDVRAALLDQLVADGRLERHERRLLGLIHLKRHLPGDIPHEAALRSRVQSTLTGSSDDEHATALTVLLNAGEVLTTALQLKGAEAREAKRRAKDVAARLGESRAGASTAGAAVGQTAATRSGSGEQW